MTIIYELDNRPSDTNHIYNNHLLHPERLNIKYIVTTKPRLKRTVIQFLTAKCTTGQNISHIRRQ